LTVSELIPISQERFAGRAWRRPESYAFAATSNLLPVVASELPQLVPQYPLCFARIGESLQLMAMTAVHPGTNLFVTPDGQWLANYVPLALRVYPFRFARVDGGDNDQRMLCFDNGRGLLTEGDEGEPFYTADGELAEIVQRNVELLTQIEQNRLATQAAVDLLDAAGVIKPWALQVQINGVQQPVDGLLRVDEAALNAVAMKKFVALRDGGALALAYGQMFSMNQLGMLRAAAMTQAQLRNRAEAAEAEKVAATFKSEILRFH
jgi:hypothetical protein